MAASLFIPESVNLIAGDNGPDNSKHLQISNVTLPKLDEKTASHHPGGGIGEVEIGGLGINALTLGFKENGFDPQTMALFGLGQNGINPYTIYGAIRDKQAGKLIELKCVCWGRLTSLETGQLERGNLSDQTHEIKEIIRYQLFWNRQEWFYYDLYASQWRVNGVSQVADVNAILRI